MIYKSNKDYPKILDIEPNFNYAKILMESYAGRVSEDTAIHLYLYQSLSSEDVWEEYSKIMLKISEVEMIHFRLLGSAIVKLGGLPVIGSIGKDKIMRLWSSDYVNYELTLKEMLEIDIEAESNAIKDYEHILTLIKDPNIIKLIERILEDERIHLAIFKQLYQQYFSSL